ncbi:MAG: fumarylacetoacetate hydrolase family protein [Phycisphaerales bacterium]|nr:fumarylacetoacetate hydrolase family protein [Phycisphaerales bacterium]
MLELIRHGHGVGVVLADGSVLALGYIIGIGRNYAAHAHEQGAEVPERPMVFTKSPASVCLSGDRIVIPTICQDRAQVDFEGELAVVLGRAARDVDESEAMGCVLGYCVANDVSARWWQKKGSGGQFCRGKSFDTFCPLGPGVVEASEVGDPQALVLETRLNGEVMQRDTTGNMIFPVEYLVSELSRGATLPAGTVILTGTPSGVGMSRDPEIWLSDGDRVEVEISGIGMLVNEVEEE